MLDIVPFLYFNIGNRKFILRRENLSAIECVTVIAILIQCLLETKNMIL